MITFNLEKKFIDYHKLSSSKYNKKDKLKKNLLKYKKLNKQIKNLTF